MRDPSVVSLSLSLSLSLFRARTTTTAKKYRRRKEKRYISKYLSNSKRSPPAQGERESPAQIISPPDIIIIIIIIIILVSSKSRAQHTHKKKRTFIGAAGIFAPLKDDDLFADDEDGARIVASGWTVSVEDNILYM